MLAGVVVDARQTELRLASELSPEALLAKEDLRQFLSATDAEKLRQFIRTWSHPSQELRQNGRLASVRQERAIPRYMSMMKDYDVTSYLVQSLLFPKTADAPKMPTVMIETPHDLSLDEGRRMWALEQLLGITLPPVTRRNSPEYEQARNLACDEWERRIQRQTAFDFLLIKSSLPTSLDEKLALVNDPTTPFMVVDALAQDRQVAVRLAAAQHYYIDSLILRKLIDHDPNSAVRETAVKSSHSLIVVEDFAAAQKTEAMTSFLSRHPITTVFAGQEQPALLPFDLEIEEHLTAMRATWTAAASVATGPQALAEAVELLVKTLHLPDAPAFCAEGGGAFYCSASTSLEPGADLNAGFAIEHGGTTIYSWHAPHQ